MSAAHVAAILDESYSEIRTPFLISLQEMEP